MERRLQQTTPHKQSEPPQHSMPQIETMNPESMHQIGALHEDDNIIP